MRPLNVMNRLLPLAALLLAGPLAAAPRGDAASARAAILDRFTAALHADVASLERLLADDLEYCSFRGTCQTKREYIGEVKSGVLKYQSIDPSVDRVKLFADSAVVLGRVTVTATRDGRRAHRESHVCRCAGVARGSMADDHLDLDDHRSTVEVAE